MPLRVLVTTDWFAPETGGGAERVAYEVVVRLAAQGHTLTVIGSRPDAGQAFPLPPEVSFTPVPAWNLSRVLGAQVSLAPGLAGTISAAVSTVRPDVIWAHSLQFQSTLASAVAARRSGVPLVVTAHIGDLREIPGLVGLVARAHEATLGRLILRRATRAIAVSGAVASHLKELAPSLPVDVVPNGVDVARFAPVPPRFDGTLVVGLLGRLVPNKGPAIAVAALAELIRRGVPARLRIAGDGPERARLAELATASGIADAVQFDGFRPDPERWFGTVDVVVRPSLTEGMPLGLLEAMAAGVPVIASDVPGNAALVDHEATGLLVPVRDPVALADALERLFRDADLRGRLRAGGRALTTTMTWEQTAELTELSLSRAVAARVGTAALGTDASERVIEGERAA